MCSSAVSSSIMCTLFDTFCLLCFFLQMKSFKRPKHKETRVTQLFCYLSKNLDIEACCYILVLFTLINKTEQKIICIFIVLAFVRHISKQKRPDENIWYWYGLSQSVTKNFHKSKSTMQCTTPKIPLSTLKHFEGNTQFQYRKSLHNGAYCTYLSRLVQ